jgi:hypothetical protein
MSLVQNDEETSSFIRAVVPVAAVDAVVITQDCDAVRAADISFCELVHLNALDRGVTSLNTPAKWAKYLTKTAGEHARWFYMPAHHAFGIGDRSAVDYRSVFRVPRSELESLKNCRVGRLNQVAYEHFRAKLANFFRRFAYDPWYPLTREEFEAYSSAIDESVQRYPWQK